MIFVGHGGSKCEPIGLFKISNLSRTFLTEQEERDKSVRVDQQRASKQTANLILTFCCSVQVSKICYEIHLQIRKLNKVKTSNGSDCPLNRLRRFHLLWCDTGNSSTANAGGGHDAN